MRRLALVLALSSLLVLAIGQMASAGEWNKGHFNEPGGNVPGKYQANSECVFNGLDEPDETYTGAGDGEPTAYIADDALWTQKPGQAVQTAGHAHRLGIAEPGDPGQACNGHLNPHR